MAIKQQLHGNTNDGNPIKRKPLRQAGQSDQEKVRDLEYQIAAFIGAVIVFMLIILKEWLAWFMHTPPQPILWTILLLIPITYSAYKIRRLLAERKNWDLGRMGEIEVSNFLDECRKEGWDIFNDIQCESDGKKFNIDHVIVSPHGIFAIETKTLRKPIVGNRRVHFDGQSTIRISGRATDRVTAPNAISKAVFLADKVLPKRKEQQSYTVKPILVYPGWSVIENQVGRDIRVLNPGQLKAVVLQQPLTLSATECNMVSIYLKERNR